MRRTVLTALVCGTFVLTACGGAQQQTQEVAPRQEPAAPVETTMEEDESGLLVGSAPLRGPDGQDHGMVEFYEGDGGLEMVVDAVGLEPGFHGLHLHAVGKCEPDSPDPKDAAKKGDFLSSGGHLGEGEHPDHVGDLPSLLVMEDGTAFLSTRSDRVDPDAVLDEDGTAVVVHAGPDNYANIPERYAAGGADEQTTKAGDAGDRVACGVVETP